MSQPVRDSDPSTFRVAVIGAGIAGLTAARVLGEHGVQVTVFDKGRGVGGRTCVREKDGVVFDHGAQYFTVRDDSFRRQVAGWLEGGVVAEWNAAIADLGRDAAETHDHPQRYVGVPGMNAMARHLAASVDVCRGVRVSGLQRTEDCWLLRDDQGRQLGVCDAVVVAIPPAQGGGLLADCPELAQRAAGTTMAPCWAVMLVFERQVPVPYAGAFVHGSPLSWVARNNSKPGRPSQECWVLHATPEWSAEHLEDSAEGVCADLSAAFFQAVGVPAVQPANAHAHRWRYARPVAEQPLGCVWSSAARIALCGDWCMAGHIEGAYLSGLAAAERLLELETTADGVG